MKSRRLKDRICITTMVTPALLLLVAFVVAPLIIGAFTSLQRTTSMVGGGTFVGLDNYVFALQDDVFWTSIKNTVYYAVFITIAKNALGLGLALLLAKKMRGLTLFRVAVFVPVTFSFIVTGVLWSWIYSPVFGILNEFLNSVGLSGLIQEWLSDPNVAMTSICVVDVWKWTGFHMVIYMAGLQKISQDLYESAAMDGAGAWQKFKSITVPQMNATIVLNVLIAFTGGFVQNFDIVKVMTDGGPFNSTEVALTYIVRNLLKFMNIGKANAMTIILVLIVSVFGFMQLKIMTKEDNYE